MSISYKNNDLAAAFLLKFDLEYLVCSHMSVWLSPSYQKMFTSLTTAVAGDEMSHIFDRALLISVGVKCDVHCFKKPTAKGAGGAN